MRVMKIWFPLNPYLPNIGVFGKMMLKPRQKRKKIVGETSKLRQNKKKMSRPQKLSKKRIRIRFPKPINQIKQEGNMWSILMMKEKKKRISI